ncbi:chitin deacetylase [Podila clonocystis]|nr:chitin deacetylase [Podila clonocystis]
MLSKFVALALVATATLLSLTQASPIPSTQTSTLSSPVLQKRAPAEIITACTVPNSFAVTFDDGPSIWTHELLDYLLLRNVKVTFFVNGLNYNLITDAPFAAVVKRAHDEGHQIASHTWAHADISAPGVDVASQMKMLDDALLNIIGVRPVYMRPPYGNTSPAALEYLGSQGYKVINWNVDTNDWLHPLDFKANLDAYKVALQSLTAPGKGFIALQHDAEQGTAEVWSKMAIEYVISKGFNVMPVGTCLGDTTGWYRS